MKRAIWCHGEEAEVPSACFAAGLTGKAGTRESWASETGARRTDLYLFCGWERARSRDPDANWKR